MKTAVLLINLGTPKELSLKAVRAYLKEFLLDPYVIDLPWIARQFLVRGIIVPFRSPKSLKAYAKIWTEQGSPLLTYSQKLTDKLSLKGHSTFLAMRYGAPSIPSVIKDIQQQGFEKIICVPLYPHYALSSTETVKQRVNDVLEELNFNSEVTFVEPFFGDDRYIKALSHTILPFKDSYDHILFSYHGLPERHITKLDNSNSCLTSKCCESPGERIKFCYRAQCVETTRKVCSSLGLSAQQHSLSFQSRLGKAWLTPYTDVVLMELAKSGVKKLAVACPAFLTDCLETLEEIQMEGAEIFKQHGGEKLTLIPCLNDEDQWVEKLNSIIFN